MPQNRQASLTVIVAGCAGLYAATKVGQILLLRAQLALGPAYVDKFKGQWALVTGSSEGIGLAIADELAAHGINVMLVSRSSAKLAKAAQQLSTKHSNVQIEFAAVDLTLPHASDKLLEQLKAQNRSVALLINNAGGGVDSAKLFHQFSEEEQFRIQALNGTIAYDLTKRLLPSMIENGQGAVVAISSQAVVMPCFMAPYAAEKAKLESLYTALNIELLNTGVTAQAFRLGAVLTPGVISTQVTSYDAHAAKLPPHEAKLPGPQPSCCCQANCACYRQGHGACVHTLPVACAHRGAFDQHLAPWSAAKAAKELS